MYPFLRRYWLEGSTATLALLLGLTFWPEDLTWVGVKDISGVYETLAILALLGSWVLKSALYAPAPPKLTTALKGSGFYEVLVRHLRICTWFITGAFISSLFLYVFAGSQPPDALLRSEANYPRWKAALLFLFVFQSFTMSYAGSMFRNLGVYMEKSRRIRAEQEDEVLRAALVRLVQQLREHGKGSEEVAAITREYRHIPHFKELSIALFWAIDGEAS